MLSDGHGCCSVDGTLWKQLHFHPSGFKWRALGNRRFIVVIEEGAFVVEKQNITVTFHSTRHPNRSMLCHMSIASHLQIQALHASGNFNPAAAGTFSRVPTARQLRFTSRQHSTSGKEASTVQTAAVAVYTSPPPGMDSSRTGRQLWWPYSDS